MNATLSTRPGRYDHPPEPARAPEHNWHEPREIRRVKLLDRFALHAGVALIKWGRRPLSVESRERRASRIEQRLAQLEREQAAERRLRLLAPLS